MVLWLPRILPLPETLPLLTTDEPLGVEAWADPSEVADGPERCALVQSLAK